MKTYDQWSSRAKQLGWSESQYSQAAYQGYVNNFKQQQQVKTNSQVQPAAPRPPAPSPQPPQQTQDLQASIEKLQNQIQEQANQSAQAAADAVRRNTRVDASSALKSTILTSPIGDISADKKKTGFLQPFGG